MVKDMVRRIMITIVLSGIILGGMSVSLANMQESPENRPASATRP
ncbi:MULTISPECIES: protein YkpC [Bacillus]|uniref:Protein YkpC n=1 Tax=Bacillus capparidis TaxID=1840411 RepID=A0ABS4CQK5_9BACI|nr:MULTISPECIES: protein YkpC [Bacillus]MBP1079851.1 hypothetical protein [Bacillus capparidis]MED1095240.1 protein YkpC [Bacillus capparidis]